MWIPSRFPPLSHHAPRRKRWGEDIKPKPVLVKRQSTTPGTSARHASSGLVVIPALSSCQTRGMPRPRHTLAGVSSFLAGNPNPKNPSLEIQKEL